MFNPHRNELNMLLELVNLSDGENDLLDIAEKKNFKLLGQFICHLIIVVTRYKKIAI